MKLSALGEFGLIEKIRKSTAGSPPSVLTGIGDDAAVLKLSASAQLLATTDMLAEGVHFDLSYTDYYSLGWKSAAVNLSDIAAMGGLPRFCLTSLGIPPTVSVEQISDFYRGLHALLRAHRTILVGGDTCSSRKDLVVSVVMLGEAEKKQVMTRFGAKPGDRIFVTGTLGDSAGGLELLKATRDEGRGTKRKGKSEIRNPKSAIKKLIERHLRPVPRVEWGRKIALSGCASSMIDISDGLSSDLSHICEQSGVGASVSAEKIPISRPLRQASDCLMKSVMQYALSGGEDYELLFTAPAAKIKKLLSLDLPVTEIGEITRTRRMLMVDGRGRKTPLRPTGYNHFLRSPG
jgi:thiamine-monophosphate kinase